MELTNTFTVASPIDEMWPTLCDIERIAPCMPGAQLTEVEGDEYRGEVKIKVGPISARFKGTARMVERDDDAHRAVLKASGKDTGGKGNANATITATAEPDGEGTKVSLTTDLSITGKVAQFGRSAMNDVSNKLLGQFVNCLETRVLAGGTDGGDDRQGDEPDDAAGGDAGTGGDDQGAARGAGASGGVTGGEPTATGGVATAGPASPVETAPAAPVGGVAAGTAATGGAAGAGAATATGPAAEGSAVRKIDAPEAEPIDLLDAAGGTVAKRMAPLGLVALLLLLWRLSRRRRRD